LLITSWALNTSTVPAYLAFVGTGQLRWNTLSHTHGRHESSSGHILGYMFGSTGGIVGTSWYLRLFDDSPHISCAIPRRPSMPSLTRFERFGDVVYFWRRRRTCHVLSSARYPRALDCCGLGLWSISRFGWSFNVATSNTNVPC
jgi:hypothetical protein